MSDEIVIEEGNIYGTWHRARNWALDMGDTIHSDEIAQKVGFRGGAVVGISHLDLFAPCYSKPLDSDGLSGVQSAFITPTH